MPTRYEAGRMEWIIYYLDAGTAGRQWFVVFQVTKAWCNPVAVDMELIWPVLCPLHATDTGD